MSEPAFSRGMPSRTSVKSNRNEIGQYVGESKPQIRSENGELYNNEIAVGTRQYNHKETGTLHQVMAHVPDRPQVYVCVSCNALFAGHQIAHNETTKYEPPDTCSACGSSEFIEIEKFPASIP